MGSLKETHGCQILGRSLYALLRRRMSHAWQADLSARRSEAELLASLEAEGEEDAGKGGEGGKKAKNKKKKEKVNFDAQTT
jgi:hypothetical protein